MNRFRSDSGSVSPVDDIEVSSPQEMKDEERECLLKNEKYDVSSPGRIKRNNWKYLDIEKPLQAGNKVGSLKPFLKLFSFFKCRKKKMWCKRILYLVFFLAACFLISYQQDLRLYFGYKVYPPYSVGNTSITIHGMCDFKNIRSSTTLRPPRIFEPKNPLSCFDDKISADERYPLSRSWDVLPSNSCINISGLNSNVCIESSKESHSITCLPSFMIIGFEKASTTELLLWLSYHPNLLGRWAETRFFSKISSPVDLESKWRSYMRDIPPLPNGRESIGKYWSYEKTPSYILNLDVAKNLRSIMPDIRLIIMVRNPAKRAYSAFAMYTQMVDYYSMKDTWNLAHLRYSSLVMRNLETGIVKFAIRGGPGGSMVPIENLPHQDRDYPHQRRWRYVSFPPHPQDFHDFLLHERNFSYVEGGAQYNYRQRRILLEGYYSTFIKEWQTQFPTEHILIIPMERLWNKNTMENLNVLQRKMGIPVFDYKKVTTFDTEMKRYELFSASTFFLDKLFNTGDKILPMLPESKQLLDEIYCESNKELKKMIGGSTLKGYSCTGD